MLHYYKMGGVIMRNKTIKMFDEETDFIEEWGKLLEDNETSAEEKGFMISNNHEVENELS